MAEKWSAAYKRSVDCGHPKGFSQRAHCQGKRKRGITEAATDAARRKSRMESSMSAFMEKVRAGRTRPVIHGWILVEPEQITGQIRGKPTNGRQRFHAWVEDANDSQYVYHYRGEYWWSPSRGDWGMRFTARVHKTDARADWDELEPTAVGTGEWSDGVLTVLSVK